MSQENVHLIDHVFDVYEAEGLGGVEHFFDPEIVVDISRSPFPDAGVFRGVAGLRTVSRGFGRAFGDDVHYEMERGRGLGEHVAALFHVTGRGPSSGIQVDFRFISVFTLRDGKIIRVAAFGDWAEALEAAGLSE